MAMLQAIPTRLLLLAMALILAGCAGGVMSDGTSPGARVSQAPVDMAGRWAFSAGATCAMNLTGADPGIEGTIRPEGGCPGNFFTSRKWTFESSALVIRDHNSQPLAQLSQVAPGRFEGQATGGQPVSLVR